ncbi:MAG: hypothetical protein IKD78_06595 [Bacteroidales bacterium]|nr:hypothetical protein [Bacteroidales bacterium]
MNQGLNPIVPVFGASRPKCRDYFLIMEIDIFEQKNPFIMVPKQAFQDRTLNATEKGLYAMMYSILPHRTYTIEELSIAARLSQPAIMTALQNLSTAGYLRFSRDGKIYFNGIY